MKRCVVALIPGEGKKLLMGKRRDTKKWTCVAGHLEDQETAMEGLVREVKEESGLEVIEAKLVDTTLNQAGSLIYTFLVKASGTVDTSGDPDKEFDSLHFVDPKTKDLHVPYDKSSAMQWWYRNQP